MMELRVVAMMLMMMVVVWASDRSAERTNGHHADVAMHADGVGCHAVDDDDLFAMVRNSVRSAPTGSLYQSYKPQSVSMRA